MEHLTVEGWTGSLSESLLAGFGAPGSCFLPVPCRRCYELDGDQRQGVY